MVDPFTGAVLTIDEIREMVDELLEANKEYLKGWKQLIKY
jgi:alpha-galactosidase/6-phospho-beta-glucosidase family protein